MRIVIVVLLIVSAAVAGTETRAKATDYPASCQVGDIWLAGEYLSRFVAAGGESYPAGPFLVVEVAIFTGEGKTVTAEPSNFRLRINGATRELPADGAANVAAAMRNPQYNQDSRGPEASAGTGAGGVGMGRPLPTERFPGDRTRNPSPPVQTREEVGAPKKGPAEGAEAAVQLAFTAGPVRRSRSGLLYFAWDGKTKGIKKIELLYEGEAGKTVLTLR
jgi:hypothetical protein